jgi:hypothetical protein
MGQRRRRELQEVWFPIGGRLNGDMRVTRRQKAAAMCEITRNVVFEEEDFEQGVWGEDATRKGRGRRGL